MIHSEKLTLKVNGRTVKILSLVFLVSVILYSCSSSGVTSGESIRLDAAATNQNLYVIEREIPGAGKLTPEDLKNISQASNGVLDGMNSEIKWLHSYVAGDKIYCIYTAPDKEMVLEHARKGGFPANSVTLVSAVIDPSTGEE